MTSPPSMPLHTVVAVRCHFDNSWVEGFEIDDVAGGDGPNSYALRRLYDGAQLPVRFAPDEVRPAD